VAGELGVGEESERRDDSISNDNNKAKTRATADPFDCVAHEVL
jgi:hypothetical protein